MTRLFTHVRSSAIAYLALFVALGGTGYAAINLPANSVGARQIRNHVITPVKFDPRAIGASVRAWASIDQNGRVLASHPRVKVLAWGAFFNGGRIKFAERIPKFGCFAIATGINNVGSATPGAITVGPIDSSEVDLTMYSNTGAIATEPVNVAVLCG